MPHITVNKDHLIEIYKAEEEDRLIILPCRIGETVYGFGERYGFICTAPLCISGFQHCNSMNGCYSRKFIVKQLVFDITMLYDFGKTIFLTEEKALKALNKYENKEDI